MQLLFLAFIVGSEWWDRHKSDLRQREQTRTHIGALTDDARRNISEESAALLATLPAASKTAADSFRIVVAPSLSVHSYGLSMIPSDASNGPVAVEFVTITGDACDFRVPSTTRHRSFVVSRADYRQFALWFDSATENYAGSSQGILDGTSFTFERRKAGRTTSGSGNIPDHHGKLAAKLLLLLKPHLKGTDIPTDPSWHIPVMKDCTA